MVLQNHTSAKIRRANGVLCNKDVLYNAVMSAREEKRAEQSRALRDAAAASGVWSSEIHLTEDSVFAEAFRHQEEAVEDCYGFNHLTSRFFAMTPTTRKASSTNNVLFRKSLGSRSGSISERQMVVGRLKSHGFFGAHHHLIGARTHRTSVWCCDPEE